jgi:hypothetical protein
VGCGGLRWVAVGCGGLCKMMVVPILVREHFAFIVIERFYIPYIYNIRKPKIKFKSHCFVRVCVRVCTSVKVITACRGNRKQTPKS